MKIKIIYILLAFSYFVSCKQAKKSSGILTSKQEKFDKIGATKHKDNSLITKNNYNLDSFLTKNDEIFWPEEGLLAYEIIDDIGNISIYFFSKSGASQWEEKMDNFSEEESEKELERIKKLPLEKFVKEFEVYAFIIDKKYIQDTPEGPYQKEAYVKELYYRNDKDVWEKIESFEVKKQEDFTKEREWSKRKLAEIIK